MADMSYLKEKPIAVLGAGAVGKAMAADCALAGQKVRICDLEPFAEKTLFGVKEQGIKFYGDQMCIRDRNRSWETAFYHPAGCSGTAVGQGGYSYGCTDPFGCIRDWV